MTVESPPRRARRIYLSIAAQPDNLGDIAIRQAAIDLVGASGLKLVVFVGLMPHDYIDAFDFPADAELTSKSSEFIARYLGDVIRARAHLIFAPGPLQLRPGAKAGVKALANLANVVAARATGGRVIALGRAIRGRGAPSFFIEKTAAGMYSLFVARDAVSATVIGRRLQQAPDLAFLRGIDLRTEGRDRVAISLRGDREVNAELVADIVVKARDAGLAPVFVTQVARDDPQHRELAKRFDAELVGWGGSAHRSQLGRVEETYRTCRFVVSDRLHALILGSLKGAAPVALRHPGSDKLSSTLEGVLTAPFIATDDHHFDDAVLSSFDQNNFEVELRAARERLAGLADKVQRLLV